MYLTFATMHGFSAFSFIMRTSLFCFEFFMRCQTTTSQANLKYWAQAVNSLPCQIRSGWYRETPVTKIQWMVFASNDRAVVGNSSGHKLIWWGMRCRFSMNPMLHRTIMRKSITSTYIHLRGNKSKPGLEEAWVIKLVKL